MKSPENPDQFLDKVPEELQEVKLPSLDFDIFEQFSLAIQNRDRNALEYLISDKLDSDGFKDKQDFIDKYLGHCKVLEKKHGQIYVQTHKGSCGGGYCIKGKPGIGVSVNSIVDNKPLWNFNVKTGIDDAHKIDFCKCYFFVINKAEV